MPPEPEPDSDPDLPPGGAYDHKKCDRRSLGHLIAKKRYEREKTNERENLLALEKESCERENWADPWKKEHVKTLEL